MAELKAVHYFTKQLRKWRENKDWSQDQLADYLSLLLGRTVRRDTVAQWENQIRALKADDAVEISGALKIPTAELFERKDAQINS